MCIYLSIKKKSEEISLKIEVMKRKEKKKKENTSRKFSMLIV